MPYPYRYAPGAEVLGQAASAIFNHMLGDEVMDSLRKHGVDQLKPDEWYPVDKFIEVFADWFKNPENTSNQLVSVGMAIIHNAVLPPEMESAPLIDKLILLGKLHDINHRGSGDPGRYVIEQLGEKHLKYTTNTPYPDDMIYGYIYGVAKRFLPRGTHFTVSYDPDVPRQHEGGTHTVFHLRWD